MNEQQEELKRIGQKIFSMKLVLKSKKKETVFAATRAALLSDECGDFLLGLHEKDLNKIQKTAVETGNNKLAGKIIFLINYIQKVKKMIDYDIRELTGLKRDDIAVMQQIIAKNKMKRPAVLAKFIEAVDLFDDAENQDKDVISIAQSIIQKKNEKKKNK